MNTLLKTILLGFAMLISLVEIEAGNEVERKSNFYGHHVPFKIHPESLSANLTTLHNQVLDQYFQFMEYSGINQNLPVIKQYVNRYDLDGLGVVQLAKKIAKDVTYNQKPNHASAIQYFILKQMGYDVILTKTENRLNCFGHLSFEPVRKTYILFNNKKYVHLDFKINRKMGSHFVYDPELSNTENRAIDHDKTRLPRLFQKKKIKHFQVVYNMTSDSHTAIINQSLVEYLRDLPLMEIGDHYTSAGTSEALNESLLPSLRKSIAPLSKMKKIQYLLAFVQQSVPYATDEELYGTEKYCFPEETLSAEAADCEDKVFLMAHLVKELVGINTVAVYFQKDQHLAIGVEVPSTASFYNFIRDGKKYMMCEPTSNFPRLGKSAFALDRIHKVYPL